MNVILHRRERNVETRGDLLVDEPLRNQCADLAFTRTQRLQHRRRALGNADHDHGLHQIHTATLLSAKAWVMFLIGATSMHPSENARRAALAQQAPPDEREGILVDTSAARRAQLASGALLLVWSIAFLWAFWEVQAEPRMGWRRTCGLWGVCCALC